MGHSDLASRVALVGEFTHEELGELGVEDTIGDCLSALGDVLVAGHLECVDLLMSGVSSMVVESVDCR